jgi:hypothetical protein
MPVTLDHLDHHRRQIDTRSGAASHLDTGGAGRPVLLRTRTSPAAGDPARPRRPARPRPATPRP